MTNFAVFILSHGRPDNCKTYGLLKKCGYTGKIYIILDDQDKTIDQYKQNFGENEIIVFDKNKWIDKTDSCENEKYPKSVVYARNAAFDIANNLGLETFLVLDDDYTAFYMKNDDKYTYCNKSIVNLDRVFKYYIDFLANTKTTCIAWAQAGDFIGGFGNRFGENITLYRKCMNSFFCRTDRPFEYLGILNDDVNTYVSRGVKGELYFTSTHISLVQAATQQNEGGLTEMYLELGTYQKSFYTVMIHPSGTKVSAMGTTNPRLHHAIAWDYTYPKLINKRYKKT